MPTTFTHDLFGKEVYKMLPRETRQKIRSHGSLYRIGLHGPDIFFYRHLYKNKIGRIGTGMHQQPAKPFFMRGLDRVREENDEALMAYLLGFACHFLLDSVCHPYIKEIETEVSHTMIEKELDRLLMEEDGKDPFVYHPSCCIHPGIQEARTIQKVFPEVKAQEIRRSLSRMKNLTNLMVYRGDTSQKLLVKTLSVLGQEKLTEHIMRKEKDPSLEPYLNELKRLFWKAREEAPALLGSMEAYVKTGAVLPSRFDRSYL